MKLTLVQSWGWKLERVHFLHFTYSSTMMITIKIKMITIAKWVEVDVNDISKPVQKIFSYVQCIFVSTIKFHDGDFHRTEMTLNVETQI